MRLYIKGDYTKSIPFGYDRMAEKMWFEEKDGRKPEFSHAGNNEMFQYDFYLSVSLSKSDLNDCRWEQIRVEKGQNPWKTYKYEEIELQFENSYISDYREKGDHLRIASTHRDLLTVDKRAMLIMAIEVAAAIDGQISEDDKATWLSVEEFKERHKEILTLTYEQATDISLEEIQIMEAVDEPLWEELEKRRQAYLDIHGPNPLFAEDEE